MTEFELWENVNNIVVSINYATINQNQNIKKLIYSELLEYVKNESISLITIEKGIDSFYYFPVKTIVLDFINAQNELKDFNPILALNLTLLHELGHYQSYNLIPPDFGEYSAWISGFSLALNLEIFSETDLKEKIIPKIII